MDASSGSKQKHKPPTAVLDSEWDARDPVLENPKLVPVEVVPVGERFVGGSAGRGVDNPKKVHRGHGKLLIEEDLTDILPFMVGMMLLADANVDVAHFTKKPRADVAWALHDIKERLRRDELRVLDA